MKCLAWLNFLFRGNAKRQMAERERKVEIRGARWEGGKAFPSYGTWDLHSPVDHRSCFGFTSVDVIRHLDQNQLKGRKGFCLFVAPPPPTIPGHALSTQKFKAGLLVISHSIMVQPRNSLHSQEVQQEPWKCHLPLMLSLLSCRVQDHCLGLVPPTVDLFLQLTVKTSPPTDIPSGQSVLGNSQLRLSSQVS